MARSTVVTVHTTPTLLNTLTDTSQGYSSIALSPPAGTTLYVGDATVTTATGFPVTGTLALDLDNNETVYGVVATATATVNVLETFI